MSDSETEVNEPQDGLSTPDQTDSGKDTQSAASKSVSADLQHDQNSQNPASSSSTVEAVKMRTDRKLSSQAKRNRIGQLTSKLSVVISQKLYQYEQAFSALDQNDSQALEEYLHVLEGDMSEVNTLYSELNVLCENKVDEKIETLCTVLHSEVQSSRDAIGNFAN